MPPHVGRFSWSAHRMPAVLLDNVLTAQDFARIGLTVGSDHRPVIAEFVWR